MEDRLCTKRVSIEMNENEVDCYIDGDRNEIDYALKWLHENEVDCYIDGDSLYIRLDNIDVEVSASEIHYRSDLWFLL